MHKDRRAKVQKQSSNSGPQQSLTDGLPPLSNNATVGVKKTADNSDNNSSSSSNNSNSSDLKIGQRPTLAHQNAKQNSIGSADFEFTWRDRSSFDENDDLSTSDCGDIPNLSDFSAHAASLSSNSRSLSGTLFPLLQAEEAETAVATTTVTTTGTTSAAATGTTSAAATGTTTATAGERQHSSPIVRPLPDAPTRQSLASSIFHARDSSIGQHSFSPTSGLPMNSSGSTSAETTSTKGSPPAVVYSTSTSSSAATATPVELGDSGASRRASSVLFDTSEAEAAAAATFAASEDLDNYYSSRNSRCFTALAAECSVESLEPTFSVSYERRQAIWQKMKEMVPAIAKENFRKIQKNASYARLCIDDAFAGRLKNGLAANSKKGWLIYTVFYIQTSTWLFRCVMYACVFHTFSIFFEPEQACSASVLYRALQVLVLCVYTFDIALKMYYEGIKEYWGHNWQQLYVIVTLLMAADLLFCGCTHFSNPLRPVVGILRARNGRRFFEILKKMVPGMSHSLVPLMFFVVIVMVLSTLLFDVHIREFEHTSYTSYNWFFLFFTSDNFERLLPQHMRMQMFYLVFFFPAIYVGQQFLLSLIIGDTYETYKAFVKKQLKKEKLKEMQGLTKAFSALDEDKTGSISAIVWRECLKKYDPDIPDEAIALYFELISGGNSTVSVLQFLSLRSVLNFNLQLRGGNSGMIHHMKQQFVEAVSGRYQQLQLPCSQRLAKNAQTVIEFLRKRGVFNKVNNADLLALCFSLYDYQLVTIRGSVITPCLVITLFYVLEFLLHLVANEGKLFKVHEKMGTFSQLFCSGVIGRLLCMIIQLVYRSLNPATEIQLSLLGLLQLQFPFRKVILLCRALRCIRIANLNKDLRNFNMALIDVLPALGETFAFTFIITYIFGAAGNVLFGAHMEEWRTPLLSVVQTQQLSIMVDFLSTMEAAMTAVHPAAGLFFLVYLILALAVSNIALSIIIDLQNNVLAGKSSKDRDGQASRMDLVFDKIVGRARARTVLSRRGSKLLNFSHIVMSPFQSSDVRHFIAADPESGEDNLLKADEIMQCSKQSNIDLMAFYNREHRNHRDMHWEVSFLQRMRDLGYKEMNKYKPGEVLFEQDASADNLFLLVSGSVTMSMQYTSHTVVMATTCFLGTEALQIGGRYCCSCTSDGADTACLVLSKEIIFESLDSELCGDILRMSYKSASEFNRDFEEASKRAQLRRMRSMSRSRRSSITSVDSAAMHAAVSSSATHSSAAAFASKDVSPSDTPRPCSTTSNSPALDGSGSSSSNYPTGTFMRVSISPVPLGCASSESTFSADDDSLSSTPATSTTSSPAMVPRQQRPGISRGNSGNTATAAATIMRGLGARQESGKENSASSSGGGGSSGIGISSNSAGSSSSSSTCATHSGSHPSAASKGQQH